MRLIRSANIAGKRWAFDWTPPPPEDKAHGECHWDLRTIQIDPNEKPQQLLDTIIHEIIHPCEPAMSEARVEKLANAISGALWRIGYRC